MNFKDNFSFFRFLRKNKKKICFLNFKPRTSSISEKEMILIGTNNTLPPSFPTTNDKSGRINRSIKNSSSFPQSFDNTEQLKQLQGLILFNFLFLPTLGQKDKMVKWLFLVIYLFLGHYGFCHFVRLSILSICTFRLISILS